MMCDCLGSAIHVSQDNLCLYSPLYHGMQRELVDALTNMKAGNALG